MGLPLREFLHSYTTQHIQTCIRAHMHTHVHTGMGTHIPEHPDEVCLHVIPPRQLQLPPGSHSGLTAVRSQHSRKASCVPGAVVGSGETQKGPWVRGVSILE